MKGFLVCIGFIGLLACKTCKDCYLIENEGAANEQETAIGEKCGDELEYLDGKTYVTANGSGSRSWHLFKI